DRARRSVPDPRGLTPSVGAEPLAAAVDRDRHRVEQDLVGRIRQFRFELLHDPRCTWSRSEQTRDDLVGRLELDELLLERAREPAAAEIPAVELLQKAGGPPL